MNNALITVFGKTISFASRLTNRGSGSTWPGHIALGLEKNYIKKLLKTSSMQIILIVGTNGKTTTGKILTTILEKNLPAGRHRKKHVIQNSSGANLVNGIASALLTSTSLTGRLTADYAIFEVDENNLPLVLEELTPKAIIVLDLFRDQLDRYGELDSIAQKWQKAFTQLPPSTQLILNADDPLVAYLGLSLSSRTNVRDLSLRHSELVSESKIDKISRDARNDIPTISYFGLDATQEDGHALQHAADSLYCPRCTNKLHFQKIFYSHLGIWKCPHCKLQRPLPHLAATYFPLEGTYNKYNTLAAALTAQTLGFNKEAIEQTLHTVTPAFGRQEKLTIHGTSVQIFLAKNPTSFNETLRTIHEKGAKHVAFVLNDRIPDGRDVSWIWDIDLESYVDKFSNIVVAGDRVYDMGLRIAYSKNDQFLISNFQSNPNFHMFENLQEALQAAISKTPENETLYILPTYSAMLEVRKILTGRKIL